MRDTFQPSYSGIHKLESLSPDFITNLAKRIQSPGLFPLTSKPRNLYEIVEQKQNSLRFRSVSFLTSIYIGLNDVTIRTDRKTGEIRYDVSYWTWAKYTLGLCLLIGLVLAFLFLSPLLGLHLFSPDKYPAQTLITALGTSLAVFWGLVWPWLLIQLHKKASAKQLKRILEEVNV